MAEITNEMIDAALDATDFAKGPVSRRWMRKALAAAIEASPLRARCEKLEKALAAAADQLALVHDDAFKQAGGHGLVTTDGRDFSCFQLNRCDSAAHAARS